MHYAWKRFWYPREVSPVLSDEGYLSDPDAEYGRIINPHAVPFDALADKSCLVLLGEPGIGKSHELHGIANSLRDVDDTATRTARLYRDLGEYSTDTGLLADVFGCSEFTEWKDGSHRLVLFLDSLDESMLHVDTVARLLGTQLARHDTDRLALRITCRTATWPATLEAPLNEAWGADNVCVRQLAPLRRRDVTVAAQLHGVEADAFVDATIRRGVVPLAVKPVTLEMLLELFSTNTDLPASQFELYERGCLRLCEERRERRESGAAGQFSARQRLVAAERVAATTVLANRRSVWVGDDTTEMPDGAVPIRDLCGGTEPLGA
ncbi:hypothetical protein LCGC14_2393790, partial [marine sediment metagenome]